MAVGGVRWLKPHVSIWWCPTRRCTPGYVHRHARGHSHRSKCASNFPNLYAREHTQARACVTSTRTHARTHPRAPRARARTHTRTCTHHYRQVADDFAVVMDLITNSNKHLSACGELWIVAQEPVPVGGMLSACPHLPHIDLFSDGSGRFNVWRAGDTHTHTHTHMHPRTYVQHISANNDSYK